MFKAERQGFSPVLALNRLSCFCPEALKYKIFRRFFSLGASKTRCSFGFYSCEWSTTAHAHTVSSAYLTVCACTLINPMLMCVIKWFTHWSTLVFWNIDFSYETAHRNENHSALSFTVFIHTTQCVTSHIGPLSPQLSSTIYVLVTDAFIKCIAVIHCFTYLLS